MKKLVLVFALAGFMFSSCKKNSPLDPMGGLGLNCSNVILKYSETISTYSANPTPANCKKVQASLGDVINKCSMFTKAERDEYRKELQDWDCDDN